MLITVRKLVSKLRCCTVPAPTSNLSHTLSTIKKWKDVCSTAHPNCHRPNADTARPTRLLFFDSGQDVVRLIKVDPGKCNAYQYATLSHRWGSPEPPKLSSEEEDLEGKISIHKLENGVPISSLPQTFRDAILIVMKCGLEHLWIDSLCILQDRSVEDQNPDWDREAAKVGGIYANALFNIAATDSQNSDAGLFPKQQAILLPIVRDFPLSQTVQHADSTFNIQNSVKYLRWRGDFDFQRDIMHSELLSRGWVYQEVMLARANLFCSRKQMWWSCSSKTWSQINPGGGMLPGSRDEVEYELETLMGRRRPVSSPSRHEDPIMTWTQVLEHYTQTSVTFGDDRLAAIGGLVSVFRSTFPEAFNDALYHSGLWFPSQKRISSNPLRRASEASHAVIAQLYWYNGFDSGKIPPRRHASPRHPIPSWSPVSFAGPTRFVKKRAASPFIADFVGIHGIPDSFGRVEGYKNRSYVHVRGVHFALLIDPETLQYHPDLDWPFRPMDFNIIWDNLEETRLIPERTTLPSRDSYPIRALIFEFTPQQNWMAGIILRPLNASEQFGIDFPNYLWVRCGFFSATLERDTWHSCFEHYQLHKAGLDVRPILGRKIPEIKGWHFGTTDKRPYGNIYIY